MDQAEFDALYERDWYDLVAAVSMVCGDRAEAEDCVQEAFTRAWLRHRRLDADAGGWVRTAAIRIAVSRWRKAGTATRAWLRHAVRRDDDAPGADAAAVVLDGELWDALRTLPQAQREALVLHHVLDFSIREVADLMGVAQGTVKARLSRGRAALVDGLRPVSTRVEGRADD